MTQKGNNVMARERREKERRRARIVADQAIGLGAAIRVLRLKSRLTREALGKRAELSANFIYRMERSERMPSRQALERIARALSVDEIEISRIARARLAPVETRIYRVLTELEELSEAPGVKQ